MTRNTFVRSLLLLTTLLWVSRAAHAAELALAGSGTAPLVQTSKKNQPKELAAAFAAAENAALADALGQAVLSLMDRDTRGPDGAGIAADLARHASQFVTSSRRAHEEVSRGQVTVELALTVDPDRLRTYLRNVHTIKPQQLLLGRRFHVLAYTIEGMDPNRAEGNKLREVIVYAGRYLQSDHKDQNILYDGRRSDLDASARAQSYAGATDRREEVSRSEALADFLGPARVGSELGRRREQSVEAGASGSLDVSRRDQEEHLAKALHKQLLTVASRDYIRVTDYADTTRKGNGTTNEVRAKLEEVLQKAGLPPRFYNMKLMGLEFATEDDLYDTILAQVSLDPNIADEDYVVVTLNRLTPLPPAHHFTSFVTYRVIRKGDRDILLPPKTVLGDSGPQPSDDYGRVIATEIALSRAAAVLPGELDEALRQLREEQSVKTTPPATYLIRLVNVPSLTSSRELRQALEGAGLTYENSYNSQTRTETIKVTLRGTPPRQVRALVEQHIGPLNVTSMDERQAVLSRAP